MKENSDGSDTNVGSIGNSIEEALKKLSNGKKIKMYELLRTLKKEGIENFVITRKKYVDVILSDYKRVLKENEELTISNKEIDKECSRLEKKEVELINENEHYKDLIYALKTYYDITEEDLEKCMKNDR